jgi:beta-lactamase class A
MTAAGSWRATGSRAAAALAVLLAVLLAIPPRAPAAGKDLPELRARLAAEVKAATAAGGGTVAVSVVHVPSGRGASLEGARQLPLYSVFKLPLALTVLAEVQAGRLTLDRKLRVTAEDVVAGGAHNTARWRQVPVELDIRRLLELSIADSDNTSTDKLLALVGGPPAVQRYLRTLGLRDLHVVVSVRDQRRGDAMNRGSAEAVTRLLVRLHEGKLVPAQRALLLGFMSNASPGIRRLRGALPPDTAVANKTGTGAGGSGTNDVGLITLPGGDTLAIAVFVSGSTLPAPRQDALIATLARIAYDAFTRPGG